ncbi:hypothetical protein HMPREF9130_0970 [Peptoniphilus sp. oral taxon 375 str. F0436]|nr:hypothetical protein HMPREF9130_0970 [Peptoniphilus sp. oral taxon 375 str. F0436]
MDREKKILSLDLGSQDIAIVNGVCKKDLLEGDGFLFLTGPFTKSNLPVGDGLIFWLGMSIPKRSSSQTLEGLGEDAWPMQVLTDFSSRENLLNRCDLSLMAGKKRQRWSF